MDNLHVTLEGFGEEVFQVIGCYTDQYYEHGIIECGDEVCCWDENRNMYDGKVSQVVL